MPVAPGPLQPSGSLPLDLHQLQLQLNLVPRSKVHLPRGHAPTAGDQAPHINPRQPQPVLVGGFQPSFDLPWPGTMERYMEFGSRLGACMMSATNTRASSVGMQCSPSQKAGSVEGG